MKCTKCGYPDWWVDDGCDKCGFEAEKEGEK